MMNTEDSMDSDSDSDSEESEDYLYGCEEI